MNTKNWHFYLHALVILFATTHICAMQRYQRVVCKAAQKIVKHEKQQTFMNFFDLPSIKNTWLPLHPHYYNFACSNPLFIALCVHTAHNASAQLPKLRTTIARTYQSLANQPDHNFERVRLTGYDMQLLTSAVRWQGLQINNKKITYPVVVNGKPLNLSFIHNKQEALPENASMQEVIATLKGKNTVTRVKPAQVANDAGTMQDFQSLMDCIS
jgi:hypothetical protein